MADALKALREVQTNRVVGNWELTEPLSRGGQGVTWRAMWKFETHSAVTAVMVGSEIRKSVVKLMIPPSPTDLPVPAARYPQVLEQIADEFFEEFAILSHLDCPYIPKFYQADRQATKAGWKVPWCAIELIEGRSLDDQRRKHGPIKEGPLLEVAHNVLTALDAIHSAGLVHLDLKPANVMLEPGRAILIDFGIAGQANVAQHGIGGTPGFFPPENLDDQLERNDFSPAVDLFKLGVTLASAAGIDPTDLWGLPPAAPRGLGPFGEAGLRQASRAAMRQGPNLDGLTPGLTRLLKTLLAFEPDRRGTARSILNQVESLQVVAPAAAVPKPKASPTPRKQAPIPAAASSGGKSANVGAKIEVVDQLGLNWTGVVVNLDPKKANHILVRHESIRGASNIRSYPLSRVVKGNPLK